MNMTEPIHIAECMRRDIGLGLNNLIAKGLYECAVDAEPSRATATEQSDSRAAAADDPKYRIWPSQRNHSVGAISEYDRIAALIAVRSNSAAGFRSEKVSKMMFPDPPKPTLSQPLQKRRKPSVQDLVTKVSAVERCMDSPTLPRQPLVKPAPRQLMRDRSSSEPREIQQAVQHARPIVTATTKETIKVKLKADTVTLPATTYSPNEESQPPAYERFQQELQPSSFLSPLMIPEFGFDGEFGLINTMDFGKAKELPPPVPPKSPRMERSSSPIKIATNHANGSSATLVNSSRAASPNTPQEAPQSPKKLERATKRVEDIPQVVPPSASSRPKRAPSGYRQRDRHSGMYSGRIMKPVVRKEVVVSRDSISGPDASNEVLSNAEVLTLSRELYDLEDKCEHLRSTHNSLRASRRTLRSRMITYLKSPRVSAFSRKNVLGREEALAELELSIDDIVHKLEHSEAQRTMIRQRLLQHIAATLHKRNASARSHLGRHTPPHSPSNNSQRSGLRKKVGHIDSIESSCNATIESLLSDIEVMVLAPHTI